MFTSPLKEYQARLSQQAARAEASARPGKVAIASMPQSSTGLAGQSQTAALLEKALAEDLAALKGLASFERKAEFKRDTLIPRYRESVRSLMQGKKPHPAVAYYLVWCFDAALVSEGLEVALWAMEHGQELPERFKSSVPFFTSSQLCDWAEAEFKAGHDFEPYFTQCFEAIEEGAWNLDDATRARFYRLYGLKAAQDEDWARAVEQLEKALALGAQVSTRLAEVRKRLEKAEAAETR